MYTIPTVLSSFFSFSPSCWLWRWRSASCVPSFAECLRNKSLFSNRVMWMNSVNIQGISWEVLSSNWNFCIYTKVCFQNILAIHTSTKKRLRINIEQNILLWLFLVTLLKMEVKQTISLITTQLHQFQFLSGITCALI